MSALERFTIPIPNYFSFEETLSFLDRGFDECLHNLSEDGVSKLMQLSDGKGIIRIFQKEGVLEVELHKRKITKHNLQEVRLFVLEWFDLERNIEPFYQLLDKKKTIAYFTEKYYGSRIVGIPNLFEALCWAVIGQQINLPFAYKLKRLLVEKYGEKEVVDGQTYYAFPTPDSLAKATRSELVEMKFSRQKIDYLMNIADVFMNGELSKTILLNCKNKEERIQKLIAIKGIGIWSANYVLMKTIRDMSCITYGDSGLNKAIHILFETDKKPSKSAIDEIFREFKGWESYLNFYLWKSLG